MIDFGKLLQSLTESGVDFVVVGGVAATVHGASRLTQDVDVVYARDDKNIANLAAALSPLSPYPRGAPPGLPFQWNKETIAAGLNFTLTTEAGDIDLLGEITGGGGYDALISDSLKVEVFGLQLQVLELPKLIEVKRAAGRPKDFEAVAELTLLLRDSEVE